MHTVMNCVAVQASKRMVSGVKTWTNKTQ